MAEQEFASIVPDNVPAGKRLDRYLAEDLGICRRNRLKHQLAEIFCNGRPAKLSTHVSPGDRVAGILAAPPQSVAEGQPIPLCVLYEGPTYLVIDKAQGLVVHPGAGNPDGTLVNALLWRYRDAPFFQDCEELDREGLRPGIVHRLDKDTSGVMIIAKNPDTHHHLVDQFSRGVVEKRYIAITRGSLRRNEGVIDEPIGRDPHNRQRFAINHRSGKQARTAWNVLRRAPGYNVVLLRPSTGRTHQIRVHLAFLGAPVLGDPLYARRDSGFPEATLMLHALTLRLSPAPGLSRRVFRGAIPERFHEVFQSLSHEMITASRGRAPGNRD